MDDWTIENFSQPHMLDNGPGSAKAARVLEQTAAQGDEQDVRQVLDTMAPFETTTIAFAIAVARGKTEMARMLGREGNEMRKPTGGDHGNFVVCGGSIAMSGYIGHPHFPEDFCEIEVDGGNCETILELAREGYFGGSVLTSILSSCLYEVGRFGQELRTNEDYYLSQGESRYSEADLARWREKEQLYYETADRLCDISEHELDVKRLLGGRLEVYAYDKVTRFLCEHFPDRISAAWVPSRWRFDERQLSRKETDNLKVVFPYLHPYDVPRRDSLMRCVAINGLTEELRIMSGWPDLFTEENLERCIDLAASNNHPDSAAYLLDCKTQLFPKDDLSDSLLL